MENRKDINVSIDIPDLIKSDQIVVLLIKKINNLFIELNADIETKAFKCLQKEINAAFSTWDNWFKKVDKPEIINNFVKIEGIIAEIKKDHIDFIEKFWQDENIINKKNIDAVDIVNQLKVIITNLINLRLHLIINFLQEISYILPKKFQDNGYEIAFVIIPDDYDLENKEEKKIIREASLKREGIPILIKHKDNIYIYGNKARADNKDISEWGITKLDKSKVDINLFPDRELVIEVKNKAVITNEVYAAIKAKLAHSHSELAKKIETYCLLFESRLKGASQIENALIFFEDNMIILQVKYEKTLSLINTVRDDFYHLKQSILNYSNEVNDFKLSIKEMDKYLIEASLAIQSSVENNNKKELLKNIDGLHKTLDYLKKSFQYFVETIEHTEKTLEHMKEDIDIHTNKITDIIQRYKEKSQMLLNYLFHDIKNNSKYIEVLSQEIDNIQNELFELNEPLTHICLSAKLISNNLLKAKNLQDKLLEARSNLRNDLLLNSETTLPEVSNIPFVEVTERPILSFKDASHDELINKKINSLKGYQLQPQQTKALINYTAMQIRKHKWSVFGLKKPTKIINKVTKMEEDHKVILSTTYLTTSTHALEMVNIINDFKIHGTTSEDCYKKLSKVNKKANNSASFFRSPSTTFFYQRMQRDMKEVPVIANNQQGDAVLAEIDQWLATVDPKYFMTDFKTHYQIIINKRELSINDKLIQLYYLTNDFLYNKKNLPEIEMIHFYHIMLKLLNVDIEKNLSDIKRKIIYQCVHHQWPLILSTTSITINGIDYQVPLHINKIWGLLTLNYIEKFVSREEKLAAIMMVLEKTVASPSIFRHASLQEFYINLLNQIVANKYEEHSCPRLN